MTGTVLIVHHLFETPVDLKVNSKICLIIFIINMWYSWFILA